MFEGNSEVEAELDARQSHWDRAIASVSLPCCATSHVIYSWYLLYLHVRNKNQWCDMSFLPNSAFYDIVWLTLNWLTLVTNTTYGIYNTHQKML